MFLGIVYKIEKLIKIMFQVRFVNIKKRNVTLVHVCMEPPAVRLIPCISSVPAFQATEVPTVR